MAKWWILNILGDDILFKFQSLYNNFTINWGNHSEFLTPKADMRKVSLKTKIYYFFYDHRILEL